MEAEREAARAVVVRKAVAAAGRGGDVGRLWRVAELSPSVGLTRPLLPILRGVFLPLMPVEGGGVG